MSFRITTSETDQEEKRDQNRPEVGHRAAANKVALSFPLSDTYMQTYMFYCFTDVCLLCFILYNCFLKLFYLLFEISTVLLYIVLLDFEEQTPLLNSISIFYFLFCNKKNKHFYYKEPRFE